MTLLAHDRRLRVLMYVQHLTGVGHFVRVGEIAKALAVRHEVMITDGGAPAPRPGLEAVTALPLPRIRQGRLGLEPIQKGVGIEAVMSERAAILRDTARRWRPDVLIVEHYPFGKWRLGPEIDAFVTEARTANPGLKVVCSVRDIRPRTRHEPASDADYATGVSIRLRAGFDQILIHGDPVLSRLETQLPFLAQVGLPLAYTGIVSEKPAPVAGPSIDPTGCGAPFVLVSVGGGEDRMDLLGRALEAWRSLRDGGRLAGWRLVLCPGLAGSFQAVGRWSETVIVRPFSTDFLACLGAAELSISCAGYNTCANLLETRARAILAPDPISDQCERAAVLAAHGLAVMIAPDQTEPNVLAEAIVERLARPRPQHNVRLDGAERSRELVEALAAEDRMAHVGLR